MKLPILAIPRTDSRALNTYRLPPEEQGLFREMETELGQLPMTASLAEYHQAASQIGPKYGLAAESIAFWPRTTFSEFEL